MTLKKTRNLHHSSASCSSINSTQFRTIIKNRINKETINTIVNQSCITQSPKQSEQNYSKQYSASIYKKSENNKLQTDNLKNFVRNMKKNVNNSILHNKQQIQKDKLKYSITYNRQEREEKLKSKDKGQKLREQENIRNSSWSVKSTKTVMQNSMVRVNDDKQNDCKSVISNRSLCESRYLNQVLGKDEDKLQQSKFNKVQKQSNKKVCQKLLNLQQRFQYLLKKKLKDLASRAKSNQRYNPKSFLASRTSFTNSSEYIEDQSLLSQQISNIQKEIMELKSKDFYEFQSTEYSQQSLLDLNKKIQLLQTLLASNYTQSQILKKFYFSQKSQKYPHLNRKQKILQEMQKRKNVLNTNFSVVQQPNSKNKSPMIQYQSTSKYFYKRHSKNAYNNQPKKFQSFIINRQPLPRSTYGRQYLNYGTLPVFNYKPHDSKYLNSKLNIKTSNYQQTFKQKSFEMKQIDYKQLDCYRNKLKMGKISFGQLIKSKENKWKTQKGKKGIQHNKKLIEKQVKKDQDKKQSKSSVEKALETLSKLQKEKLLKQNNKITFMGETEMKRSFKWPINVKTQQNQCIKVAQTDLQSKQNYKLSQNSKINDNTSERLKDLKAKFKIQMLR